MVWAVGVPDSGASNAQYMAALLNVENSFGGTATAAFLRTRRPVAPLDLD